MRGLIRVFLLVSGFIALGLGWWRWQSLAIATESDTCISAAFGNASYDNTSQIALWIPRFNIIRSFPIGGYPDDRALSPNAEWILVTSDYERGPVTAYHYRPHRPSVEMLTSAEKDVTIVGWSPDSKRVVFLAAWGTDRPSDRTAGTYLYVVEVETGKTISLQWYSYAAGVDVNVTPSPDPRWVLVESNYSRGLFHLVDTERGTIAPLVDLRNFELLSGYASVTNWWTRDARYIWFSRIINGESVSVRVTRATGTTVLYNPDYTYTQRVSVPDQAWTMVVNATDTGTALWRLDDTTLTLTPLHHMDGYALYFWLWYSPTEAVVEWDDGTTHALGYFDMESGQLTKTSVVAYAYETWLPDQNLLIFDGPSREAGINPTHDLYALTVPTTKVEWLETLYHATHLSRIPCENRTMYTTQHGLYDSETDMHMTDPQWLTLDLPYHRTTPRATSAALASISAGVILSIRRRGRAR